jgi:radical SAM superfamily enzyme YgiQ (UPF0313 family)
LVSLLASTPTSTPGCSRPPGWILLLSCYELGHAPQGLASPLGFLARSGFSAQAIDLAIAPLDEQAVAAARFIGISVPMHTALRLGLALLGRLRRLNPGAFICFYGLYASLNAEHLFARGADAVIGGELELALVELVEALDRGLPLEQVEGVSFPHKPSAPRIARLDYALPRRDQLASIERYAHIEGGGLSGPAGYVEATRGCLHRCRHCPITPVYEGRFFAVPSAVVLEDARAQVRAGATHLSFGDPDFFNGPSHALRITCALHAEHPHLTFDCTIKVEHILRHRALFPELASLGCVFVTSAFESTSDEVLAHLAKGHVRADEARALAVVRDAGIALSPTWVPFTPWTTLASFGDMLDFIEEHALVEAVAPVQYSIRLLVPPGSALLAHPPMQAFLGPLDAAALTFRWAHPDPRMDRLHQRIFAAVTRAAEEGEEEVATFATVRALWAEAQGIEPVPVRRSERRGKSPPRLSEAWFC